MKAPTIDVTINNMRLQAVLEKGHCLAIPLDHEQPQPNAFYAPMYDAAPHTFDNWVGDTRSGASVNFYNIRLNPHGNGTHTECVGHIAKERYYVHDALADGYFVAALITVYPTQHEDGDRIIEALEWEDGVEALIIRTMPNYPDKRFRQYGGTNPAYLAAPLVRQMAASGIKHLLLDLPSVDREEDGGALAAHRAFWNYPENPRLDATITEMIFVDNTIADGLYLLQVQMPALMLDASPSRPYIYPLR
jgi:arylformamidase